MRVSVVVVLIAGSDKEADAGAVRQGLEEGRGGDVQAAADLHGRPQGQARHEFEQCCAGTVQLRLQQARPARRALRSDLPPDHREPQEVT